MPITVRLATEDDLDAIAEMAERNVVDTLPHLTFDRQRVVDTVTEYLTTAEPTIFVAEDGAGHVTGMLVSSIQQYRAASGLFTTQEVLFVSPGARGTRAAAALMKHLIAWSKSLGAIEIIGGVDNGFQPDRTARFLGHFGFEMVGYAMKRRL
jgi:L-amino acid N-acyltransferase YncA